MKAARLLAFVLPFAAAAAAPAKDLAIIVGINEYPGLNRLRACVPDSYCVAAVLNKKGFDVSRHLVDAQATKRTIMQSLTNVAAIITKADRFVFYYAGHGMPDPPRLVPFDYAPGKVDGITTDDLYAAVRKIGDKAKSTTVVLDSCFSGGLSKGIEDVDKSLEISGLKARCYIPPGPKFLPKSTPNPTFKHADTTPTDLAPKDDDLPPAKKVCYAFAASGNQSSYEAQFFDDFRYHGLFTKFLLPVLAQDEDTWDAGIKHVSVLIDQKLAQHAVSHPPRLYQDPGVTPDYKPARPFEQLYAEPKNTVPNSVMEQILDRPNSDVLSIDVRPNTRQFHLGERMDISITVKRDGYLAVLGRDAITKLIWPTSRLAADAKVAKDGPPVVPKESPDQKQFFDTVGNNEIIAVWFATQKAAQRFFDAVPPSATSLAQLEKAKMEPDQDPADAVYATAREVYDVADLLVGGYEIYDARKLWSLLSAGKFSEINGLDWFQGGDWRPSRLDNWAADPTSGDALKNDLELRLNRLLSTTGDWPNPDWKSALPPNLATRLGDLKHKPLSPEDGAEMLAALMPSAIRQALSPGSTASSAAALVTAKGGTN